MQVRSLTRQGSCEKPVRIAATVILAFVATLTLILVCRTLWYLLDSVTNVPYADQWVMLDEVRNVREGRLGWSYLWSPYWGQRPLLPRLLFLFSISYFHYSMLPFILINVIVQSWLVVMLIRTVGKLFRYSNLFFWVSAIALVHLLFSSLQMEILIQGIEVQYTIGYASAVGAICVLGAALDAKCAFEPRFWTAILLGIMSTTCLAIGPLVWPALIVEIWIRNARRRHHLVILNALALLAISAYAIGYTRPEIGMGFSGIVRHPISGLSIVAMVLGGPITLYSRALGTLTGYIGIVTTLGILIYFWRKRLVTAPKISLILVCCFMIGSAASIAIGRFSPEWLASYRGQPLPSRYLAPTFIFWAALLVVLLACRRSGRLWNIGSSIVSIIVLTMTFGTWNWQWRMPVAWASVSQGFDAIASGFILSVSDQEFMSRVFPNEDIRNRLVGYMRQERLSVFAEARAAWTDQDITMIAHGNSEKKCSATITTKLSLGGNPPASRIIGTITINGRPPGERLDILITDARGRVEGLARTLPAQSEGKHVTDFFGYTRYPDGSMLSTSRFFVLFPDGRSCVIQIP